MRFLYIFATFILLSACATDPAPPHTPTSASKTIIDPSDAVMKQAIRRFVQRNGAPAASAYDFNRVDLNHDGRREALVLFKSPYGHWCENHGCKLLILKAHNDHFTEVSTITPFRGPLYVTEQKTNHWRNLVIRVSGRQSKAKNVTLRFDGAHYPQNPAKMPGHEYHDLSNYLKIFR